MGEEGETGWVFEVEVVVEVGTGSLLEVEVEEAGI